MSLIHKALKKAMGGEKKEEVTPGLPAEEFVGKKPGLKEQLTPRTAVLLVLVVLAFVFMLYKKCSRDTTYRPPAPAATQQPATAPGATPSQAVQPVPSNLPPDIVVEEGKKLYAEGKLDEALTKFIEASLKNPQDPEVFNNIGLIYKKKNDYAKAEEYYRKALTLNPSYAEGLNNMGVLKSALGDPLAASVYLKKAITVDSTYADAYFNLGVLNDQEGNYREAIANYKFFLQYTDSSDNQLLGKIRERIEQLSE